MLTHKRYTAVENIVRKREIVCNKQFLLFSLGFLSYMVLIFHFTCTLKCHLQFVSIWTHSKILSSGNELTLYLICQFWALPIQQQIKIWCQKYGQMRYNYLMHWVETIHFEQFLLFPQCFQKLSVVDASKWVSVEYRVKVSIAAN